MKLISKMKTSSGKIVISIILGIGLAALFRTACQDEECYHYVAPNPAEFEGKTIKSDSKCYQYTLEKASCPSKVSNNNNMNDEPKIIRYE